MRLSQSAPIGQISVDLELQELLMLRLLVCPKNQIAEVWIALWKTVADYEALHFFCRDFMPTAVMRLQKYKLLDHLIYFVPGNHHFIRGLPKFSWSKNQLLLREAHNIINLFSLARIDISFIKGVGKMLETQELSLFRVSRDIDILVKWEQLEQSIDLLEKNGWIIKDRARKAEILFNESNALDFFHPIKNIEIDLHRSFTHDQAAQAKMHMSEVWSRASLASENKYHYVMSPQDQLELSINNAFNLFNWETSQFCKYIYDIYSIVYHLSDENLSMLSVSLQQEKLRGQFLQVVKVIESLDVNLPYYQFYCNVVAVEKAKIQARETSFCLLKGRSVLLIINGHKMCLFFIRELFLKKFSRSFCFYIIFKLVKILGRLFSSIYRLSKSILSLTHTKSPSIFKNRLKWYLFI